MSGGLTKKEKKSIDNIIAFSSKRRVNYFIVGVLFLMSIERIIRGIIFDDHGHFFFAFCFLLSSAYFFQMIIIYGRVAKVITKLQKQIDEISEKSIENPCSDELNADH